MTYIRYILVDLRNFKSSVSQHNLSRYLAEVVVTQISAALEVAKQPGYWYQYPMPLSIANLNMKEVEVQLKNVKSLKEV